MAFDAEKELTKIQSKRKMMKRKRFHRSVLDKHKAEVLKLRTTGASLSDIRLYLKTKRVSVVNSTIKRWLDKNV